MALFRGVNVGGHGRLPMKELALLLESLGLKDVRTYLQSGNAVFRHGRVRPQALSARIGGTIRERFGFEPAVLLLPAGRLQAVVQANPYPEAEAEPRTLHVFFLASRAPAPDLASLERLRGHGERFALGDDVLYLHAPDGIARSKLAAGAEKLVGVPVTARNWRSVTKILELAR